MTTFRQMGQRLRNGVSSDGRQSMSYMIKYLFESSSVSELSVIDVQSLLGLRPGVGFADDPNATLGEIDIDRRESRPPHSAWDVNVNYATNAKVPENDSQDPTEQRVKMSKRYSEQTKQIIKDRDGELIVNAAKEPFKDGVSVPTFPHSFVYEWNRKTPTLGFHETVNQNTFNGIEPGKLMCLITNELVYEGGFGSYWHETIEMRHNPNGWNPNPLNAGLNELSYDNDVTGAVPCLDKGNQPFTDPQPLFDGTSAGEPWSSVDVAGKMIPIEFRPDACVTIEVDHFEEKPFEKIGVREFPE